MQLQTHRCDQCGAKLQAACLSELQEKLKKHSCQKINKKVERTLQLQQAQIDQLVNDVAVDRIYQHKFDQLVKQGMFVTV